MRWVTRLVPRLNSLGYLPQDDAEGGWSGGLADAGGRLWTAVAAIDVSRRLNAFGIRLADAACMQRAKARRGLACAAVARFRLGF